MSDNLRKPEHWVDELTEKHECGGYRDPVTIELDHSGRSLTLVAPFPFEDRAEILETTISPSGDLLYLIAKEPREEAYMGFATILIVAIRRDQDRYEVVVWHELYPWAIERLGLEDRANPSRVVFRGE